MNSTQIWNLKSASNEIRTKSFRKIRKNHRQWSLHQHHPIRIWTHRIKRLGQSDAFTKNVFNILIHKFTASNPLNIQQCNQWVYSIAYIIQRHFQSYPAKITASGRSVEQQAVETVAKMGCTLIDPSHFRPGKFLFKKNENSYESIHTNIGCIPKHCA